MTFFEKLKLIASDRGTTLTGLERDLGFSNISLDWLLLDENNSNYLSKEDEQILSLLKESSSVDKERILNYLTIATTNKNLLISDNSLIKESSLNSYDFASQVNCLTRHIPLRGYVAAGTPIEAVENDLGTISSYSPEADFALIVNGNSMYPLINDGDYVFVKACKQLNNGDIGVFYYNGSVTCKKYFKNDSILKLISINPTYEDFTFSLEDQKNEFLNFTIEGKVILSESQKKNQ